MTAMPARPTSTASGTRARTEILEDRPVNLDGFVEEWPEVGMVAMDSPYDPEPSVRVEDGVIVEMDGRAARRLRLPRPVHRRPRDRRRHRRAVDGHPRAARSRTMLVDPRVTRGRGPRGHPRPDAGQAARGRQDDEHRRDHDGHAEDARPAHPGQPGALAPARGTTRVQVAADAAEAALRGFAELETTLGVVRYAPLVAIALQIGGQAGSGGVLTQCALEEATELELGMRGITAYAETISVYGTESVFVDGDDTPWSKAFLASAYASRGIKMRFTSGTGSEVQMGNAEGKSMLYLEIRCILVAKGAGVQGLQNGSISCIGVPGAVPGGHPGGGRREPHRQHASTWSAPPATTSRSRTRRCGAPRALMPQMLPGTDFVCSGYSAVPNYDNMFAGSNCRPRGLRRLEHHPARPAGRRRAAARRRRPRSWPCAPGGRGAAGGVRATSTCRRSPTTRSRPATYAHGSKELPVRDVLEDLKGAQPVMDRERHRPRPGQGPGGGRFPRRRREPARRCCASGSRATCCRPRRS